MCDITERTHRDQEAGKLHSGLQQFHDRFLSSQLDIVTSDPARFMAWLVLFRALFTLLLGHLLCLALLGLFSFSWLYVSNLSLKSGDREEEQEEEWLLDRFLCFLHHLDHETSDTELVGREEESETGEGKETVSSAVTLASTDSSSDCPDQQLEDLE